MISQSDFSPQAAPHNRPGAFSDFSACVQEIKTLSINRAKDPKECRSQTPPPATAHASSGFKAQLSEFSSPPVPNSGWSSANFVLGAGVVIIQPSTHKIVLLYRAKDNVWFFPRGRKDIGESIQHAALREAYEESGYEVRLLPVCHPTRAPGSSHDPEAGKRPNSEPFYVTLGSWRSSPWKKHGGEYLTSWFIGEISSDAVYIKGTGMENERCFTTHLCTYGEALSRIWGEEKQVLEYAWAVYLYTLKCTRRSNSILAIDNENIVLSGVQKRGVVSEPDD